MRMLDHFSVENIARGSAVLASGGGGDPYRGALAASAYLSEFGPVPLLELNELPEEAVLSTPFLIGAPLALLEKFPFGVELERALAGLQRLTGKRISALFAGEIGGVNSLLPIGLAAKMGLSVVDADTMGRAYPETDMTLTNLAGYPMAPLVVADDHGTEVSVATDDGRISENIGRIVSLQFGAAVGAAAMCNTAGELRNALVPGTLTKAEEIGKILRNASLDVEASWAEVLDFTGGTQIFEGRITALRQDIEGAFGKGLVSIEGTGSYKGDRLQIVVINENLSARTPERVLASAPDIISIIDDTSGLALTTENVRYGYKVRVVALPCDERWLSPEGLALGGPSRFNFDFEYEPFSGRQTRINSL
ncbi:DUF917 domain-containing protein [Paenarthrobacter sp. NPDC089322]|uniref:DUF917 domain-containing protein n=1 Tax=Paenarthrobacter sp. NPDC089322 TaxID=3155065 RepID=UPI00343CB3DC